MCMLRGFLARGLYVQRMNNGTITVRDQYETLSRWNGNQLGINMISTGMYGTARHGTSPNNASAIRVNTFERAAPPRWRIATRARCICGASGLSPASFNA